MGPVEDAAQEDTIRTKRGRPELEIWPPFQIGLCAMKDEARNCPIDDLNYMNFRCSMNSHPAT
jgi:hypothetical protein